MRADLGVTNLGARGVLAPDEQFDAISVQFALPYLFQSEARALCFFDASVKAASSLHASMVRSLVGAPLAFFHTTPAGRILNRLTKDQGIADDYLPSVAFDSLQSVFMAIGTREERREREEREKRQRETMKRERREREREGERREKRG